VATLTLIGEPFPDIEARAQTAASRCLADALAETAPRGCSSRLIVARDAEPPQLTSARARVEAVPLNTGALPLLWLTGTTARPLDGEFVHAGTPLVPLRARAEDDGSQTSVVIPHTLAWDAPELMGAAHAKRYITFAKRAAKLADLVLAPTHAAAERLRERLIVDVKVLPLAAPVEYVSGPQSSSLRASLGLHGRYIATTALPGEHGRLDWLLNALEENPSLPPLVVLHLGSTPLPPVRESLAGRVHVIEVSDLAEVGAVLSGALLLALPQTEIGAGFEVLGALSSHVPVLHAGCQTVAELALEAAVDGEDEPGFILALVRLCSEAAEEELAKLRIFAEDRSHTFSWRNTAWQLWELHANL